MSANHNDAGLKQLGPTHWIKDGHHVGSRRTGGHRGASKVGVKSITRRAKLSTRCRKVKVTLPILNLLP